MWMTSTGQTASVRRRGDAAFWLSSALVLFLWYLLGTATTQVAYRQDFLNLYTGSWMARDGQFDSLHDPVLQLEYERRNVPDRDTLVPFVRPHVYAALLAPLSLLPYRTAFAVWLTLQSLLYLGCCVWAMRRYGPPAFLWGLVFPGAALGITFGQDPAVLLLTAIGGYVLAGRGREREAGLIWALGLVKYHLLFGLVAGILLARRWRLLQGFLAGATLIAGGSLLLAGRAGAAAYLSMVTNPRMQGLSPSPDLMINLQSIAVNFDLQNRAFFVAAGLVCAGLFWMAARNAPLWRWYSASMLFGLIIVPHVYAYDGTVLLLAVWLMLFVSKDKLTRIAAAAMAAPVLIWLNLAGRPWSAAGALALVFALVALARLGWLERRAASGLVELGEKAASPGDVRAEVLGHTLPDVGQ
jgi:hypothetical protein